MFVDQEGSLYEGNWLADKKFGRGRLIEGGGDVYVGEWVNNQREGRGH